MPDALGVAGWTAGRKIATRDWTQQLTAAGFELNDTAVGVWAEFGELTINSCPPRVPASSLYIEPVDACVDAAAEASRLRHRYAENYSPLGMWSVQYRSYIATSGRVVAVWPGVLWPLGSTFAEALAYVVDGDAGADPQPRSSQAPMLAASPGGSFPLLMMLSARRRIGRARWGFGTASTAAIPP